MNSTMLILPKYVDDAIQTNYLGLGLAKNVKALSDILSPRDLSFYILVNEPGYLVALLRTKLSAYADRYSIKLRKSIAVIESLATSFNQSSIETDNQELLNEIATLRLELLGASLEDVLGYLGSLSLGENPYISVAYKGISADYIAICPQFVSDETDISDDVGIIIKHLMALFPLHEVAPLGLFKVWEVSHAKKQH